MPRDDSPTQASRRGRRSLILAILLAELVAVLVTSVEVVAVVHHLDRNIATGGAIDHTVPSAVTPSEQQAPTKPLNILVLGTDTRAGTGDSIDKEKGCNCSDTTILVHVSADRTSAYGISIPRDALVPPVPCTRDAQYLDTGLVEWNQAYSVGGPQCTAEQLERDFHVYVNDYVVIDFSGFVDMVDSIGGVDVCVPFTLSDPKYAKVTFEAGNAVHLDGARALAYVRLRHVLDGTDTGRIKRQQVFIRALVDKMTALGTLTRPDRVYGFANALTKSITTDPDLAHVKDLVGLAEQFRHIPLSHIRFVTLPSQAYPVPQGDPRWGRVQVLPSAQRLMRIVARDEPLGTFAKGALSAGHHRKRDSQSAHDAAMAAGICG